MIIEKKVINKNYKTRNKISLQSIVVRFRLKQMFCEIEKFYKFQINTDTILIIISFKKILQQVKLN